MAKEKKRIVLGVSGSIAAYRGAELASLLKKRGFDVDVVLTAQAEKFITPLTFRALTHREVYTEEKELEAVGKPPHVELGDAADLVVIAPATANIIAQISLGLASDTLTSLLLVTRAPILIAPAMNGKMWQHPATQEHVKRIKGRGGEFIGPEAEGELACGYEGEGRLWCVKKIKEKIEALLEERES